MEDTKFALILHGMMFGMIQSGELSECEKDLVEDLMEIISVHMNTPH